MKEEKREKESKAKKKLTRIIGTIIVGGVLMITAGCGITGKGSRSWLENEVSDIEKVYPTENPEDLFEKFPNGFSITQTKLFTDKGDRYNIALEIKGDKDTRKIEGKVKKVLIESEPYKETIEKESKVEYIKDKGLVLEKSELTTELLPRNYFLLPLFLLLHALYFLFCIYRFVFFQLLTEQLPQLQLIFLSLSFSLFCSFCSIYYILNSQFPKYII